MTEAVAEARTVNAVAESKGIRAVAVTRNPQAVAVSQEIRAVAESKVIIAAADRGGAPGKQGSPGAPSNVGVTVEALVDLNAYTVVKVMGSGKARPASSLVYTDGEATTGITVTAARAGEPVAIRTVGALNVAGSLPVGPLYLGEDGALTTSPDTGLFQLRVGYAQTPNLLVIRIDPPIDR